MSGWKTKLAGAGVILTGLGVIVAGIVAGELQQCVEGALVALGGLAALGLGHKVDKVKAFFEKLTEPEEKK